MIKRKLHNPLNCTFWSLHTVHSGKNRIIHVLAIKKLFHLTILLFMSAGDGTWFGNIWRKQPSLIGYDAQYEFLCLCSGKSKENASLGAYIFPEALLELQKD